MRYLCLVYGEEAALHTLSADERAVLVDESMAYDEALHQHGCLVVAHALSPTRTARTVRVRGRQAMVTDGPFAETKEQLLGFILIEAKSQADAIDAAAGIPLARTGSIEVRPIMIPSREPSTV